MSVCIEIRRATNLDIANLKEMVLDEQDYSFGSITAGSEFVGAIVFVIQFGSEIAGFVTFRSASSEIFPIFVFSRYRRKGIAFEAMNQLIALLKENGREELIIEVREGAEAFWMRVFADYPVKCIAESKFSLDISKR
ncbi:GNAT family N-acetyltransferase [Pseudomonas sp. TTU2014-080ASC]|uniref:GNAT family N-acetyltransferase n=1 Tax=Pseudomonas sp. TTU2014-080ASC TaxID=1729724 RepID=UPI000AB724E9|nr:GNAT family N-acetyltransferase [Pseudomonas sp. TTU2014-080ASC]